MINSSNIILNEQQEKIKNEAIEWFLHSSDQLFEISGLAGTGKSVLIAAILNELGLSANQVAAMAYTGQASIVMRTKGFPNAKSIHSTLYDVVEIPEANNNLAKKFGVKGTRRVFKLKSYINPSISLFFIDEAWMVPESMVKDILSFNIKVIAAGDSHQLPPINSKPGFLMSNKVHYLTQLMRQAESDPIVYLSQRAIHGLPIHNGLYGNVLVINDTDFVPEMISFADCVLCGTNATRDTMNNYIRYLAGYNGILPNPGERVICRKNNWDMIIGDIALANGLTGTVLNSPDPSRFNNKDNTFSIDFLPDISTRVFHDIKLNYKYFSSPYDIKRSLRDDYKASKWLRGELFDYAYALTVHLSQGSEYNNVLYIEEYMYGTDMKQLNYTAITRAKKSLIYIKKTGKYFKLPNLDNNDIPLE